MGVQTNEQIIIEAWTLNATSAGCHGHRGGKEAQLKPSDCSACAVPLISCDVEFLVIFRAILVGGIGFGKQMSGGSGSGGA